MMTNDEQTTKKLRGLGRGLNALFEDDEAVYPQADPDGQTPGVPRTMLGVDQMEPGGSYQPRKHFDQDALKELAASISVHGVLQPILVRPKQGFDGTYEIVAGERRWRAAQIANLHEVPVIIKKLSDKDTLEIALIENLQRADLDPLEEARGYQLLIEEFGHTQEKLAAGLGKSRSHVANMMRLLTLPNSVQALIRQNKISAGHARALVTAKEPEELARIVIEQGLSVRETERLAADTAGRPQKKKPSALKIKDVDTMALEKEITNLLGMKVAIDMSPKGKGGTFRVAFSSLDQLDEVLHRLSHNPGRMQTG